MPEKKQLKVFWTDNALQNTIAIKKYLELNFSDNEIISFYSLLTSFEKAVLSFPKLYPESGIKKKIRRAVLSKVFSVFYKISKNTIEVIAVLDNRCDASKWF